MTHLRNHRFTYTFGFAHFRLPYIFPLFSVNEHALGKLLTAHQSSGWHSGLLCLLSPLVAFLLKQRRNCQIRLAVLEMWSRLLYSQAPKIRYTLNGLNRHFLRSMNPPRGVFHSRVQCSLETPGVRGQKEGLGVEAGSNLSATPTS